MNMDYGHVTPALRSADIAGRETTLTRQEMEARRLAAVGDFKRLSQAAIARKYGVSRTTASRWKAAIVAGESLKLRKAPGRPARLTERQRHLLISLYRSCEGWTTATFADAILEAIGVSYDRDHVGRLIIKWGLKPKRPRAPNGSRRLVL